MRQVQNDVSLTFRRATFGTSHVRVELFESWPQRQYRSILGECWIRHRENRLSGELPHLFELDQVLQWIWQLGRPVVAVDREVVRWR